MKEWGLCREIGVCHDKTKLIGMTRVKGWYYKGCFVRGNHPCSDAITRQHKYLSLLILQRKCQLLMIAS